MFERIVYRRMIEFYNRFSYLAIERIPERETSVGVA